MNDGNAKQQIVDKIKNSSNILVTVSANPSVDELSAALGLTLLLNKMKKHATAVVSGDIPPAITFLDPEKTFESTVDSLRDFIIALDKEKADHLRYKVDGDVVKIFITPYRTTISDEDLEFSQGDYNVELVLALGVKSQDNLDKALAAHGRILHDATVASINVSQDKSELGSLEWREPNVSSLSEVLVGLNDALKNDKQMLDEQIATAFLTGIVAATDRFSNNLTSSRVMTISAQLMAAGANQQLIASKLEEAHAIGDTKTDEQLVDDNDNSDGTTDLSEGESTKLDKRPRNRGNKRKEAEQPKKDDGSLVISHEKEGSLEEVSEATALEQQEAAAQAAEEKLAEQTEAVPAKNQDEAAEVAEQHLAEQLATVTPEASADTPSVADLQKDLAAASADVDKAAEQSPASVEPPLSGAVSGDIWKSSTNEPQMGGTLNATTEQAADDKRRSLESDRNRTILSHDTGEYIGDQTPAYQSPINSVAQSSEEPSVPDVFQAPAPQVSDASIAAPTAYAPTVEPLSDSETLAQLDERSRTPHDEARDAVNAAFSTAEPMSYEPTPLADPVPNSFGSSPSPSPEATPAPSFEAPPLPPLPDFSTLPPLPPVPGFETPTPQADSLPPENLGDILPAAPPAPSAPQPTDPGQFKIPGQQ